MLTAVSVGHPEQFAKRTFANEVEPITRGAVTWQDPPEVGLVKVQADGLLLVRTPALLASLPPPWPEAMAYDEVVVELKMPGDHLDKIAFERARLRRQARQVERMEKTLPGQTPWTGYAPLWCVAPHLPQWLAQELAPQPAFAGCYRIEPWHAPVLWIAANELPLCDELVPFLVARSGRALVEFVNWAFARKSDAWLLDMVEFVPMTAAIQEDVLLRLAARTEDPELEERRLMILRAYLKARPAFVEKLINEGVEKGFEKGVEKTVLPIVHLFERRLKRMLSSTERDCIRKRIQSDGGEQIGDVVLDLSAEELAAWLASPIP